MKADKLAAKAAPGLLAGAMLLLLLPSTALAEGQTQYAGADDQRRWYGWQTLATDGAALTLTAGGIALDAGKGKALGIAMGSVGVATFLLGGPTVHFAHGRLVAAAGSLALRVGLPLVAGSIGFGIGKAGGENCRDAEVCPLFQTTVGALIGVGAAIATDAAVLAYDNAPQLSSSSLRRQWTVAPRVSLGAGRFALGVVGSF